MFPRGNLHNQRFFTIGHSIGQSFPVLSPSCLCHLPTSLLHVLLGIPTFRLPCGHRVITSHTHYVSLMLSSSDPRNHSHISFTLRISCYHISHALCIAHVIIIRPKKPWYYSELLRISNNDLKCAMSDHPFSDFLRKTVMPEMGRGST